MILFFVKKGKAMGTGWDLLLPGWRVVAPKKKDLTLLAFNQIVHCRYQDDMLLYLQSSLRRSNVTSIFIFSSPFSVANRGCSPPSDPSRNNPGNSQQKEGLKQCCSRMKAHPTSQGVMLLRSSQSFGLQFTHYYLYPKIQIEKRKVVIHQNANAV